MNFNYFLALTLALFGVFANAYIGSGYNGLGYHLNGGTYGASPAAVYDTCQCVKTVVRPVVEQIPYTCSRRVHAPGTLAGTVGGVYGGGAYGGGAYGNGAYGGAAYGVGAVGTGVLGTTTGILNGCGNTYGANVIV